MFGYAASCGFVAAAIIATGYQWATNSPARFEVEAVRLSTAVMRVMVAVLSAPYIIMRNAVRGRLIEGRPLGWLAASTAIAALWSVCSGIMWIQIMLVMRSF